MPFTARRVSSKPKKSTRRKKVTLHKYQKRIVKFFKTRNSAGAFVAPGLGKTLSTLTALKQLKDAGEIDKILIVAKLRICHLVWPKEISKWGFNFTHSVLHGSKKEKLFADDSDIHLVNYEAIKWLNTKLKGSNRNKYCVCVLDESSKIKNVAAKRSKMLHFLAPQFKRRYILTGSPTPRSLMDIYSQIKFLDLGERLGKYVSKFRNEYFYPTGYMGYDWKPFQDSEKRITAKIKDIIIRVSHEEAGLELPKENAVVRRVKLPASVMKTYKELEDDFIALVEDQTITAATAAVATNKLRQVASGGIYNEAHETVALHDEKTEELIEIVEELQGSPVLVAYEYGHDLKRLQAAFPDAPHIGGGVDTKTSMQIESDWNKGKIPVLFGQPDSIAHGLNLQDGGCHTVVFYSVPWNLENYEQFIQRVLRQGNKSDFVTVIHIVADSTVDEDVMISLYAKDKTQQTFLNSLEERLNIKIVNDRGDKMDKFKVLHKHYPFPLGPAFSKNPSREFTREHSEMLFTHNFVLGFKDRLSAWLPKHHVAFLKDMGAKKIKDDTPLGKLYERSLLMTLEILGAALNSDGYYTLSNAKTLDEVLILYRGKKPMVKKSRISEEIETGEVLDGEVEKYEKPKRSRKTKSKEHFDEQVAKQQEEKPAKKKPAKKKAAPKKAVEKKPVKKKAAPKKAVEKKPVKKKAAGRKPKTEIKYKPNNVVKVLKDEFPRAVFRIEVLKIVRRARNKKLGNIMQNLQVKLEASEAKCFKALEGLRDQGYINFKG